MDLEIKNSLHLLIFIIRFIESNIHIIAIHNSYFQYLENINLAPRLLNFFHAQLR